MKNKDVLEHFITMDEDRMEMKDKYNELVVKYNDLAKGHNKLLEQRNIYKKEASEASLHILNLFCNSFKHGTNKDFVKLKNLKTKKVLFNLITKMEQKQVESIKPRQDMEQKERDTCGVCMSDTAANVHTTGFPGVTFQVGGMQ